MKHFLAVAGLSILALIVMDSSQVVIGPAGLVLKAGQAMAADIPVKAPPPPPAPVGKGKAPIIGKGKGKAPVVASRY
jgi:hypothetical protein